METELLIGFGAAGAWGVSAYLGAVAARQFGGWVTNLGVLLASLATLLPLVGIGLASARTWADASDLALLVAVGVGTLVLNVVIFQLLASGPVAVLYPILSANAAVVVVLAVILLGERLLPLQALGIALVLGGVVTIGAGARSADPGQGLGLREPPGRGRVAASRDVSTVAILVAGGVTVSAGGLLFLVATFSKELGWYQPVLVERLGQGIVIAVGLVAGFPPRADLAGHGRRAWVILVAAGILDGIAIALYGLGNEIGSTALTATAASTFAVVPVVLAVVLLRERPNRVQATGGLAVLAGVLALALA